MKKFNLALTLLALLCASLCGCGGHSVTPTEADAIKIVENRFNRNGKDSGVHVKSLTKTNGQTAEMNGIQYYKLDYDYEMECDKDACNDGYVHKKGDTHPFKDNAMTFEKTEKGWKGEDGNLY